MLKSRIIISTSFPQQFSVEKAESQTQVDKLISIIYILLKTYHAQDSFSNTNGFICRFMCFSSHTWQTTRRLSFPPWNLSKFHWFIPGRVYKTGVPAAVWLSCAHVYRFRTAGIFLMQVLSVTWLPSSILLFSLACY